MLDFINHWPVLWREFGQICLTFLLTAVIGGEREHEEHTAGVRTFPLVGIASCGCLLIFGSTSSADQSRVLQGIVTGIGFVGAGAILREGATVRGTATAASIWNAGIIGASIGTGHYEIGVLLTLLNLFTLHVLMPLKNWLDSRNRARRPQ